MSRQIPWARVFVEGVVIVGSILMAFGIDAWWDTREERDQEQILLRSLAAEFTETRDSLAGSLDAHRDYEDVSLRLAEFGMSGAAEVPNGLEQAAFMAFHSLHSTHLRTGTLDGTIASGRLGVVSNPDLRSALAMWPSTFEEFAEQERFIYDWVTHTAQPIVTSAYPAAPGLAAELDPATSAPGRLVDFVRSEIGQNLAARRNFLEVLTIRDGELLLEAVDKLIAMLEAEIR